MATIQGIYVALFGRPADPGGLAYWQGITDDGADLSRIVDLAQMQEYQDRFGGQTNEQVVNAIYLSLFNREAEPAGLAFWVEGLNSGRFAINDIAIRILDGAQGSDRDILDAKLAAADLFTLRLDLPQEVDAYMGNDAAAIGHGYLDLITTDHPATAPLADEWILKLFGDPGGGQGPGGGAEPEPEPEPEPVITFTAFVNDDGKLEFSGSATGDIVASIDAGSLIFTRQGKTATLSGPQDFDGLADPSPTIASADENSDVLGYTPASGWAFFFDGRGQLLDYSTAVGGGNSTILLTSGFKSLVDVSALGEIEDGEDPLEHLEEVITSFLPVATSDLALVTAADANASVLPMLEVLARALLSEDADFEGDVDEAVQMLLDAIADLIPTGLPVAMGGNATRLSADGLSGFTLLGRSGENDVLIGGRGADFLMGQGGEGGLTFNMDDDSLDFALPEFGKGGDWLTGGAGADLFGYDGVESGFLFITDFSIEEGDALLLNIGEDAVIVGHPDDEADYTFIAFSGSDSNFILDAGIVLLDVKLTEMPGLCGCGLGEGVW